MLTDVFSLLAGQSSIYKDNTSVPQCKDWRLQGVKGQKRSHSMIPNIFGQPLRLRNVGQVRTLTQHANLYGILFQAR